MHKKSMSLSTDIISRTVRTEKLFNFEVGKCFYVNIQASKKNEKNGDEPIIKITNSVCKDVGGRLSKITEIRFKEKLIVIEDQYAFGCHAQIPESSGDRTESQPTKSSDGSSHSNPLHPEPKSDGRSMRKKKLIFKKKYLEDDQRMERRNTKNIAKNFCKAFINYLEEKQNNSAVQKAKQLMAHYNYNNKTIEALGQQPRLRDFFVEFLKVRAGEWVDNSRISDKQIHKQAIDLYLSLLGNGNYDRENNRVFGKGNNIEKIGRSDSVYESDQIFEENQSARYRKNQAI